MNGMYKRHRPQHRARHPAHGHHSTLPLLGSFLVLIVLAGFMLLSYQATALAITPTATNFQQATNIWAPTKPSEVLSVTFTKPTCKPGDNPAYNFMLATKEACGAALVGKDAKYAPLFGDKSSVTATFKASDLAEGSFCLVTGCIIPVPGHPDASIWTSVAEYKLITKSAPGTVPLKLRWAAPFDTGAGSQIAGYATHPINKDIYLVADKMLYRLNPNGTKVAEVAPPEGTSFRYNPLFARVRAPQASEAITDVNAPSGKTLNFFGGLDAPVRDAVVVATTNGLEAYDANNLALLCESGLTPGANICWKTDKVKATGQPVVGANNEVFVPVADGISRVTFNGAVTAKVVNQPGRAGAITAGQFGLFYWSDGKKLYADTRYSNPAYWVHNGDTIVLWQKEFGWDTDKGWPCQGHLTSKYSTSYGSSDMKKIFCGSISENSINTCSFDTGHIASCECGDIETAEYNCKDYVGCVCNYQKVVPTLIPAFTFTGELIGGPTYLKELSNLYNSQPTVLPSEKRDIVAITTFANGNSVVWLLYTRPGFLQSEPATVWEVESKSDPIPGRVTFGPIYVPKAGVVPDFYKDTWYMLAGTSQSLTIVSGTSTVNTYGDHTRPIITNYYQAPLGQLAAPAIELTEPKRLADTVSIGAMQVVQLGESKTEGGVQMQNIPLGTDAVPTRSPMVVGSVTYVGRGNKFYAFVRDFMPPVYKAGTIHSMYADKTMNEIFKDETAKLCGTFTDNFGVAKVAAEVNTTPDLLNWKEVVSTDAGRAVTFDGCLDWKPTASPDSVLWRLRAEDAAGNIGFSLAAQLDVIDTPRVDTKIPQITVKDVSAVPKEGWNWTMPYYISIKWSDEVEMHSGELHTCFVNATNPCTDKKDFPATGFIGMFGKEDWFNWTMPEYLPDPGFNVAAEKGTWKWFVRGCDYAKNHGQTSNHCVDTDITAIYIKDITPPVFFNTSQSKNAIAPSGDLLTLSVVIADREQPKVNFTLTDSNGMVNSEPKPPTSIVRTSDTRAPYGPVWNATLVIPLTGKNLDDLQNSRLGWFVTIEDGAKNRIDTSVDGKPSYDRYFDIDDVTPPSVIDFKVLATDVRATDQATITFNASDAHSGLYGYKASIRYNSSDTNKIVETRVYDGGAIGKPGIVASVKIPVATKLDMVGRKVDITVNVTDLAGNKRSNIATINVGSPPCFDSTIPNITQPVFSNLTVRTGQTISITAYANDYVDAQACGGLSYVDLNADGGHIGRIKLNDLSSPYVISKVPSVPPEPTKVRNFSVNFAWTIPVPDSTEIASGKMIVGIGGMLPGDIGRGVGTGGGPGIITTRAVTPSGRYAPFGLPGTNMTVWLTVYDLEGWFRFTNAVKIYVIDDEPPKISDMAQSSTTLIPGDTENITACVADNGALANIKLSTDEGGSFKVWQTKTLSKMAGNKQCVTFSWSNPQISYGTTVSWKLQATDEIGNSAYTEEQSFKINSKPPNWTTKLQVPTRPIVRQSVGIKVLWNDDRGLQGAVLMTNETGRFLEAGRVTLNGRSAWSNFTWSNPAVPAGTVVAWKVTGTDIDGNANDTDPTFTVEADTEPPQFVAGSLKQSTDKPVEGGVVEMTASFTDNSLLVKAVIETTESGKLQNITTVDLSGTAATATYRWRNPSVKPATIVKWRMYAVDGSGLVTVTPQLNFTVQETPKVCPRCPEPTAFSRCGLTSDKTYKQSRTVYECSEATDFECKLKQEIKSCTPTPQDAAFDAIASARQALIDAQAEGRDTTVAQDILTEAELAYASGNYTGAQSRAQDVVKAIGAPSKPVPVELIVVVIALVAIVAGTVLYFSRKRTGAKPGAPEEMPEAVPPAPETTE